MQYEYKHLESTEIISTAFFSAPFTGMNVPLAAPDICGPTVERNVGAFGSHLLFKEEDVTVFFRKFRIFIYHRELFTYFSIDYTKSKTKASPTLDLELCEGFLKVSIRLRTDVYKASAS